MARINVSRCGPGRPRTRPERVVADKGHSSTKIRSYLRRRGMILRFTISNGLITDYRVFEDSLGITRTHLGEPLTTTPA